MPPAGIIRSSLYFPR